MHQSWCIDTNMHWGADLCHRTFPRQQWHSGWRSIKIWAYHHINTCFHWRHSTIHPEQVQTQCEWGGKETKCHHPGFGSLVQPGPVWRYLDIGYQNISPEDRVEHCWGLRLVWCDESLEERHRGGSLSTQLAVSYFPSAVLCLRTKIQYTLEF